MFTKDILKPKKQERVKAWLTALRNGEYAQGRQALKTHDGRFCCLGVACDISHTGKWKPTTPLGDVLYVVKGEEHSGELPGYVMNYYAIDDSCGSYGDLQALTNDNDVKGRSFKQIAQIIEREMKKAIKKYEKEAKSAGSF